MTVAPATRVVLEFDHHAPETSHNRDAVLERVRDHPLFWTEANGGHWVVTSHALAKRVLKDAKVFSSEKHADGTAGVTIPTVMGPRLIPAESDAPYHRHLRKVLTPKFNRAAAEDLRPMVERVVTEAVDACIAKRDFDVVHDLADVIPAGMMVALLGFPEEQRVPFIRSIQAALSAMPQAAEAAASGEMSEALQQGMQEFLAAVETIKALIAERKEQPSDDLVSYLCKPEHELDDDERLWLAFTLMVGGFENPAALISNAMRMIATDDGLRARLREQPELVPSATEEFVRTVTAGVSLARNIVEDVELEGTQLRAGERILIWLPAANHDDAVFTEPKQFDPERSPCPHVGFGDGPHVCVGVHLARIQFQVLLEQVLTRMPDFTVDLERAVRFDDAATMWGYRSMPATTNL